jgi:UDP-N-acetylmuramyl pentapeptide phosphotransferase/UDP-N-acetylglucosamine-1-phosphate transferase
VDKRFIVLYGLTALIAALGSWLLVVFKHRVPIWDHPNDRSSHEVPKPRSGGLAILAALVIGWAWARWWSGGLLSGYERGLWLVGGAGICFLLGLLEDVVKLSELVRFLVEVSASFFIAWLGCRLRVLHLPGLQPWVMPPAVSIAVTTFWYTGFVNAFNFMDGMDGLAASEAVMAGLAICGMSGDFWPLLASAAAAGFLLLNRAPARIFMGDSGSYLLGFLLAASAVNATQAPGTAPRFVACLLVLGTFIIDTSTTLTRRIIRREKWWKAHRSHYFQKLTNLGYDHAGIFWWNLALTAGLVLSAAVYLRAEPRMQLAIIGCWAAAFAGIIGTIHWLQKQ